MHKASLTSALCGLSMLSMAGCGEAGSYELTWVMACNASKAAACTACAMENAMGCSAVGLDSVEVRVKRGEVEEAASAFPCFSAQDGPLGRGPDLDPGQVTLEVSGVSPGGLVLTGPVTTKVTIPDTGFGKACVVLQPPAACGDGVDNDGDGLVDGHDPQCQDQKDTDESK